MAVIESTVDGRYQVITRIASGGMGEVYRAHDAVLGREVALKVLHSQLAGDRGFVDRFRREARAAAILNHPNIVGVYDWGATDGGTYFMVMEFVRGQNLRGLLTEFERLEPAQVVEAALQVLAALDHAHGHGIVHRDVKPENILIAQDGTVKVADFGLARAFADSYVSQAQGVVTGTVQYLAPEQIQGEPADPRTDLYALGVVMFELLTGRPPFTGETSLAIAYKHLSGRVPAPSTFVATTPPALDQLVLKATDKDPARRPASARSMRDLTARAGAVLPPAPRVAELAAQIPSTEFVPEERAPTVTIPRAESPRRRRMRRVRWAAAIVVLLALAGFGAWAAWSYLVPHYAVVPRVRGLEVQQATDRLRAAGFTVRIGNGRPSMEIEDGHVIRTEPPGGKRIRTDSTVVLIPSVGPPLLPVPDVRGKTEDAASAALRTRGFQPRVEQAYNESVDQGRVISQSVEAGQKIEQGSVITITVSRGPPPVKVPDVVGRPAAEATTTLEAAGFAVRRADEFSEEVPTGDVIRTDPAAGVTVTKGSSVTIVVSKGPRTFPMPDVVGTSQQAAVGQLEGLGLTVRIVQLPGTTGTTVVGQDPTEGVTVEQGQRVTIYVGG